MKNFVFLRRSISENSGSLQAMAALYGRSFIKGSMTIGLVIVGSLLWFGAQKIKEEKGLAEPNQSDLLAPVEKEQRKAADFEDDRTAAEDKDKIKEEIVEQDDEVRPGG